MHTRSIVISILAVCAVIVSLQNLQASVVRLFFWDVTLPLIVLIFIVLLAGFTVGYLYGEIRGSSGNRTSRGGDDPSR